jgi:hypothetical protein
MRDERYTNYFNIITMKKLLRFTLLTVLVATSLQVSAKFYPAYKNAPKMHIGVRGGITFSTMDYSNAEVLTAPYGGLAVDFKVAKLPIYVETGAYYMDKGCRYEWWGDMETGAYYMDKGCRYEWWGDHKDYTDHNHSIFIPAVASYHFYIGKNMTLQPFTGFYTSYGIDYEKFDFGIREGVAFTYNQFYTNLGVNAGLVEQDGDEEHASIFLTVGVNF